MKPGEDRILLIQRGEKLFHENLRVQDRARARRLQIPGPKMSGVSNFKKKTYPDPGNYSHDSPTCAYAGREPDIKLPRATDGTGSTSLFHEVNKYP